MARWTTEDLGLQFLYAKAEGWLQLFEVAAAATSVPLEILLAVASRETGIRNIKGDGGHGRGIMQIDDRFHQKFIREHDEGMQPRSNINYAAVLLKSNLDRYKGDLHKALAAYNTGPGNVNKSIAAGKDPDATTAGGDYGRDVLARAEIFKILLEGKE